GRAGDELLRRVRRPGDVARVAVPDGLAAGDELDVLPGDAGVGERGARGGHAVLDEVLPPLAPRVHADPEDGDVARAHERLLSAGAHFQTTYSFSSSA